MSDQTPIDIDGQVARAVLSMDTGVFDDLARVDAAITALEKCLRTGYDNGGSGQPVYDKLPLPRGDKGETESGQIHRYDRRVRRTIEVLSITRYTLAISINRYVRIATGYADTRDPDYDEGAHKAAAAQEAEEAHKSARTAAGREELLNAMVLGWPEGWQSMTMPQIAGLLDVDYEVAEKVIDSAVHRSLLVVDGTVIGAEKTYRITGAAEPDIH